MSQQSDGKKADQTWGTKIRISIALIAIGASIAMLVIWLGASHIAQMLLIARGFSDNEAIQLERQALWGDSFGSLNALFSGIAMVAAITAVMFQTVELGAQRREIGLQIDEMEKANSTNSERLAFDKLVFSHNRQKDLQQGLSILTSTSSLEFRVAATEAQIFARSSNIVL